MSYLPFCADGSGQMPVCPGRDFRVALDRIADTYVLSPVLRADQQARLEIGRS